MVNDFSLQQFDYTTNLPSNRFINIYNSKDRFKTLGEKRNFSIAKAKYDWLITWDDDDVFLPSRVSRLYAFAQANGYSAVKENGEWYYSGGLVEFLDHGPGGGLMASMLYTRAAIESAGLYPSMNSGEDQVVNSALKDAGILYSMPVTDETCSYIHRWGSPRKHLSAIDIAGLNKKNSKNEDHYYYMLEDVVEKVKSGDEPSGSLRLTPKYDVSYTDLIQQYRERTQRTAQYHKWMSENRSLY